MKKRDCFGLALGLCLALTGCGASQGGGSAAGAFLSVVLFVLGLGVLGAALVGTYRYIQYQQRARAKGRRPRRKMNPAVYLMYVVSLVLIITALLVSMLGKGGDNNKPDEGNNPGINTGNSGSLIIDDEEDPTEEPTEEPTEPPTEAPTEPPVPFIPEKVDDSDPANWNIKWEIFNAGEKVSSFTREEPISFGAGKDYFALPGVATFRGDNYRNSPTYGTANVTQKELERVWSIEIGSSNNGRWGGCGWTGQPLIVQWDEETKNIMNLKEEKKAKEDLVEVIYATLDGKIYFLDLDDGSYTRDPIKIGMCFKGAGALDPRGYPLMYVGNGDKNSEGKVPRMYIISLIDGSILFEYGNSDPLSNRTWHAYDSSPLVDAETDTLIWPGENGLLYTFKLNTQYDKEAGTISIAPDKPVLTRYSTGRSSNASYWLGYEGSASIVDHYLYVPENGGMFYCIDLNTMELVWAQDTKDDSNSSPVFEWISGDEGYVYTAPSLHWTKNSNDTGTISIYKLDALTGEIVWEKPYDVHTVSGVSGGVQSTPLLGLEGTSIDGLIIYTISRTPNTYTGLMVALDTETGEEVWRMDMKNYAWSSPVAFYDDAGTAYVTICDSAGDVFMVDGATGELLTTSDVDSLVEATPAIFGDRMVVGTRGQRIYCVKIK